MAGWKLTFSNRKYIFKWWIFHCYVSLAEGILPRLGVHEGIWNNGHEVLVEQVRRSLWDLQSSSWMGPKNWGAKRPGCSQSAGLAHVERPYRHRGSQLWPKQTAYHHLSRCRRGGAYTSLDSHGGRDVKSVWPARPAAPAAWTTPSERRYAPTTTNKTTRTSSLRVNFNKWWAWTTTDTMFCSWHNGSRGTTPMYGHTQYPSMWTIPWTYKMDPY